MKKILLLTLVLALIGSSSAATFTMQGEDRITANASLTFQYNTSEQADYTLTIMDSQDEIALSSEEMILIDSYEPETTNDTTNESTNETTDNTTTTETESYYVYEYNYTVPDNPEVGEWTAQVFDGFARMNESYFTVYPEELRIIEAEVLPQFKNEEDNLKFEARVTNTSENVESVSVSVNNTSIQDELVLEEENRFYSVYSLENGALPQGEYQYDFEMTGENSVDSRSGSFQVYPANMDADSADIEASIASLCGVEVQRFRAPGGGVLSLNGTGSFVMDIYNNASSRTNFSANLTVTYQNETMWQPEDGYEELGPRMNMSYDTITPNSSLVPGDVSGPHVRKFNKSDTLGWYTGHLDLEASCQITDGAAKDPEVYGTEKFELTDYANFRVLVAGGGSQGKGNPTGDQAVPREANTSGAESDQEVEGDSDNPGQTEVPEPEPEPVPEPVPDPTPTVNVNLETWNYSASSDRARYARIKLEVENIGDIAAENLTIRPETESLPGSWSVRPANVAELAVNESLNRSVFVRPNEDVRPGTYRLPVYGVTDQVVDLEKIRFKVNQEIFESRIEITEAPRVIEIGASQSSQVPILLRNIGKGPVNRTDIDVQNIGSCGSVDVGSIEYIDVNESRSLALNLNASSELDTCNTTVVVSTDDGSYSFSNMEVRVVPDQGVVPPEFRFPLFASAWTILLIAYSIIMTRFELDSLQVRVPFVLLIAGEAAIFIYISTVYYGLLPDFLLPF